MPRPPGQRKATWGERFDEVGWLADDNDVYEAATAVDQMNTGSASTGTLEHTSSLDAERKEGSRFEVAYPASTRVDAYKYVPNNEDEFDSGLGNLCVRFIKQGNRKREYVYTNVPYHTYLNFHSPGTSKGKFINSTLNGIGYHEAKSKDMPYFSDF